MPGDFVLYSRLPCGGQTGGMATVYVPYGTVEGQTAKIAEYIAGVIRSHGHEATTADIKAAGDSLPDGVDAVIVGASVHIGKHESQVRDFVRTNREALQRLPSALFSVSLAAAHGGEQEAERYVEKFEAATGWRPARVGLFGGALLYTHYGFVTKQVMKTIASRAGTGDTDTTRDYVYTEWDGVKHFTEDFLEGLGS